MEFSIATGQTIPNWRVTENIHDKRHMQLWKRGELICTICYIGTENEGVVLCNGWNDYEVMLHIMQFLSQYSPATYEDIIDMNDAWGIQNKIYRAIALEIIYDRVALARRKADKQ